MVFQKDSHFGTEIFLAMNSDASNLDEIRLVV